METISLAVAFTAGLFSFLSPCVFPLVPAYVSHITDAVIEEGRVVANRKLLLFRSFGFIVGFSIIFILLGASASTIGQFISLGRDWIEKIGGLLIIVFGLQMMGFLNLKFLMNTKSWNHWEKSKGWFSSFLLGIAFGSGWTPCVGLALSSILILAGSADSWLQGTGLLSIYSLGLAIPFLLISLMLTSSLNIIKRMNRIVPLLSKINGGLMIGLGLLMYTGQFQRLSAILASYTFINY